MRKNHRKPAPIRFLLLVTALALILCGTASAANFNADELAALKKIVADNTVLQDTFFSDPEFAEEDWQAVPMETWDSAGIYWTPTKSDRNISAIFWIYEPDDQPEVDLDVTPFTALTHLTMSGLLVPDPLELPDSLRYLNLSETLLTSLPEELPAGLLYLDCSNNFIQALPNLPKGLLELEAFNNQLESLPPLPDNLYYLNIAGNQIKNIAPIPSGMITLDAADNPLEELGPLPPTLRTLAIYGDITDLRLTLPEEGLLQLHTGGILDLAAGPIFDSNSEQVGEIRQNYDDFFVIITTGRKASQDPIALDSKTKLTLVDNLPYNPKDIAALKTIQASGAAAQVFANAAFADDDWQAIDPSVFDEAGIIWTDYNADVSEYPPSQKYLTGLNWTNYSLYGTLFLPTMGYLNTLNVNDNDNLTTLDMRNQPDYDLETLPLDQISLSVAAGHTLLILEDMEIYEIYEGGRIWFEGDIVDNDDVTVLLSIHGGSAGYAGASITGVTPFNSSETRGVAGYLSDDGNGYQEFIANVSAYTREAIIEADSSLTILDLSDEEIAAIIAAGIEMGLIDPGVITNIPADFDPTTVLSTLTGAIANSFGYQVAVSDLGNMLPTIYTIEGRVFASFVSNWSTMTDDARIRLLATVTDSVGFQFAFQYANGLLDGDLLRLISPFGGDFTWAEAYDRGVIYFGEDGSLSFRVVTVDADPATFTGFIAGSCLVIADGAADGTIVDPLWLINSTQKGTGVNESYHHSSSGCATAGLGLLLAAALVLTASRFRKR